ncbi:MAG TPA: SurA N-terminal domain-containing protein [Pyrinomonadaceae bacterium]|nr:SurA N-terminal domain-containing protein [Pyrinomonadaceae bacterium]
MLKQLGRMDRTRRYIIIGFVFLMVVSLIVFYGPGRSGNVAATQNTDVVAKVGSDEITAGDLAQVAQNYQQMFGGRVSIAQLGGNKMLLDGLIRSRIINQEAERLNLGASDGEVRDRIVKQFTDASGHFVGLDRYKELVAARYGDLGTFEQELRNDIAREKLQAFVTSSVSVSDQEVQAEYEKKNSSFDLVYTVVTAEKVAEKLQPSDDELKSYYEEHKTDYRYHEPQKKIKYVYIDQSKAGSKLAISDDDLRKAFDALGPQQKQAGVKVQQIVLKVARPDLDSQVEQKAKDLLAKVMAAPPEKQEQVFSDLARGNSEDPATAKNGGFLLRPYKKNPNSVHGLYDRALDMQTGQVFDIPIKYSNNWYLLRRGDAVPKTFEEAKPELLVSQRNTRGYQVAQALAERAQARLKETKDPGKVAQELAAEANMTPAEMVKETPYVKPGDDVPNIGSSQQFEAVIEPLNNANDVGDKTGIKGGFAIPMLIDKKEPRIPDFEEVKTSVANALKQQRAREQLEQVAKQIASSSNAPGDISGAAQKAGLESDTEEGYKLGGTLADAGTSPALDEAILGLKSGEVAKAPIRVGENWIVVGVTNRKNADLAAFASERSSLTNTMLTARQSQVFDDYINAVQQRMKQEGKIKIYDDVLLKIEEAQAQIAPRPQIPLPQ